MGSYGNGNCREAADLVCSERRHLHYLNPACTGAHTASLSLSLSDCLSFHTLFTRNCTRVQITLMDSQRRRMKKASLVIRVTGSEWAPFHVRAPSQSCFYARCTSEASVISPGCRLRSARAILRFVYSCVYLPILILAITRMAGHVKGRFAHSQWMGQYWQHAHRISDQCKGLAGTRFTGLKPNSMRRVVCRKTILAWNLCKC